MGRPWAEGLSPSQGPMVTGPLLPKQRPYGPSSAISIGITYRIRIKIGIGIGIGTGNAY